MTRTRGTVASLLTVTAFLAGPAAGDGAETPRHLIYLHGRIVQVEQSARPRHPRFGYYELEEIRAAFRERGFVVSSEIRPRSASSSDSADRVVEQVRRLLQSGVPAGRISVVGASMGAGIALLSSARLQEADLRVSILGACVSAGVRSLLAEEGRAPAGHVLSIREASDASTQGCPAWSNDIAPGERLVVREILLNTGLDHGFLYRPLPEWLKPVVEWAEAE